MKELTKLFIEDIIILALKDESVINLCSEHLKYSYISNESYKSIFQAILNIYNRTGKIPAISTVSQRLVNEVHVKVLEELSKKPIPDRDDTLKEFEVFIKKNRFIHLIEKTIENYNNTDEKTDVIEATAEQAEEISEFSIEIKSGIFTSILNNFPQRNSERSDEYHRDIKTINRIPSGIKAIDDLIEGGGEPGECELFAAPSGTGKTMYLRYRGLMAALSGRKVLHISGEDSLDKCVTGYDRAWIGLSKREVSQGIGGKVYNKTLNSMKLAGMKGGSIDIVAFEELDSATMIDIINIVKVYMDINKQAPDLILIDYLELFPPDKKAYKMDTSGEKLRRDRSAAKIKNMAMYFKSFIIAATQTGDIDPKDRNDPKYIITRHNTEGARTLIKPFNYVYTWNQTNAEYKNNTGRIYVDKFRDFYGGQIIRIMTAFDRFRFYDAKLTRERGVLYEE